jgi:hypothetical protein
MTNGLLIYGEIFEHFLIYYIGSPSSYLTLQLLWISLYMRKIWFSFLSVLLSVYKESRPQHCEKAPLYFSFLSENSFIKDRQSRCWYWDIFPATCIDLFHIPSCRKILPVPGMRNFTFLHAKKSCPWRKTGPGSRDQNFLAWGNVKGLFPGSGRLFRHRHGSTHDLSF